jgi:hypothetical protein
VSWSYVQPETVCWKWTSVPISARSDACINDRVVVIETSTGRDGSAVMPTALGSRPEGCPGEPRPWAELLSPAAVWRVLGRSTTDRCGAQDQPADVGRGPEDRQALGLRGSSEPMDVRHGSAPNLITLAAVGLTSVAAGSILGSVESRRVRVVRRRSRQCSGLTSSSLNAVGRSVHGHHRFWRGRSFSLPSPASSRERMAWRRTRSERALSPNVLAT